MATAVTSPNPTVGAVIVVDGEIVGEGVTEAPGTGPSGPPATGPSGPGLPGHRAGTAVSGRTVASLLLFLAGLASRGTGTKLLDLLNGRFEMFLNRGGL